LIRPGTGIALFALLVAVGLVSFSFWRGQTMRFIHFIFRQLLNAVCRIPWINRRIGADADRRFPAGEDYGSAAPWLFVLSVLKFAFTALRFVAIAAAMNMGLGVAEIVLFVPGAQFAAFFALTPGGLGIADWSWSALLIKIGARESMVVPYLISLRLVISLSIIVIAGFSRLFYSKPARGGN
jgi:uncharacterized membrane protein YbhN (UPF0104 family)